MIITRPTQLRELLNLVHDWWFNTERIAFDEESKTVTIRLEKEKRNLAKSSKDGVRLLIKNVERLVVNDPEKVRDYDLNEIKFDALGGHLLITGGIPISIEVKLTTLNIEVLIGNQ